MKQEPLGPDQQDQYDPGTDLNSWESAWPNEGFFPTYRDIDTSHHTIYRHAHHAPEQLWKREDDN